MFIFNPIGQRIFGTIIGKTGNVTETVSYDFMNYISSCLLTLGGILQFISVTLIFTVFNCRKPPTNKMVLTNTNASNLINYELFYIFACLMSVITFVIILAIDNDFNNIGMKITLIIMLSIFLIIVSFMFNSAYQIYYNIIIKGNQLYVGVPTITIDNNKPTDSPDIPTTTPPIQLPYCTKSVNTAPGITPDPNQCY